ncbi:MAG: helix-turn-helix domain-containing protein [Myxococcota bacterium]
MHRRDRLGKEEELIMRCMECGGTEFQSEKISHLLDGLVRVPATQHTCQSCGDQSVEIGDFETLYHAIANEFVRQQQRLAPTQMRWLRKYMGFSGHDFAARLGIQRETLSNWENGHRDAPLSADLAIRFMVAMGEKFTDYAPKDQAPTIDLSGGIEFHKNSASRWVRA